MSLHRLRDLHKRRQSQAQSSLADSNSSFRWSSEEFTLRELVEDQAARLPALVQVTEGYMGRDGTHTLARDEVYWLHSIAYQTRLVTCVQGTVISIPEDFPVKVHAFRKTGLVKRDLSIKELINVKCDYFKFASEHRLQLFDGAAGGKALPLERMAIMEYYEEPFFVGYGLVEGILSQHEYAIPSYVPIRVSMAVDVATDVGSTIDDLAEEFTKLVNSFSHSNVRTNKEIMVFEGKPKGGDYIYMEPKFLIRSFNEVSKSAEVAAQPRSCRGRLEGSGPQDTASLAEPKQPRRVHPPPLPSRKNSVKQTSTRERSGIAIKEAVVLLKEPSLRGLVKPRQQDAPASPPLVGPEGSQDCSDELYDKIDERSMIQARPSPPPAQTAVAAFHTELEKGFKRMQLKKQSRAQSVVEESRVAPEKTTADDSLALPAKNAVVKRSAARRKAECRPSTIIEADYETLSQFLGKPSDGKLEGGKMKAVRSASNNPSPSSPDTADLTHSEAAKERPPKAGLGQNLEDRKLKENQAIRIAANNPPPGNARAAEPTRPAAAAADLHRKTVRQTDKHDSTEQCSSDVKAHVSPETSPSPLASSSQVDEPSAAPLSPSANITDLSVIPSDLSTLSIGQVCQCLTLLNMASCVESFKAEQMDGAFLTTLTEDELIEELHVKRLHARKLIHFIKGWRPKTT